MRDDIEERSRRRVRGRKYTEGGWRGGTLEEGGRGDEYAERG